MMIMYSPSIYVFLLQIDDTEKNELANKLKAAMFNAKEVNFPEMKFYKVPFTSVLDLVRSRKVYLEKVCLFFVVLCFCISELHFDLNFYI